MTTIEQIERLQKLLAEGAISQSEFQELKRKVIAGESVSDSMTSVASETPIKIPATHATSYVAPETPLDDEGKPHKVYGQSDFVPPSRPKTLTTQTTATAPAKNNIAKILGVMALLAVIGALSWYYLLKPTTKVQPAQTAANTPAAQSQNDQPYNITSQASSDEEDPFELNDMQVEAANNTTFKTYRGENVSDPIVYPTEIVKPKEPVIATTATGTTTTSKKKGAGDTVAQTTTTTAKKVQEFVSPAGDVIMFIREDDGSGSIAGKYREELNTIGGNKTVTYKLLKDNFFVVSGYKGDNVYYQKTVNNNGKLKTFYTEYPRSKKAEMDPVTVRMSRSFK